MSLPLISAPSPFFEPITSGYAATTQAGRIQIRGNEARLSRPGYAATHALRWVGAGGELRGSAPTGGVTNYVMSEDAARWRLGIPHFAQVESLGLYRGVNVTYYFSAGNLEFDLTVEPGADPSVARFELSESPRLSINEDGELVADSNSGTYKYRRPLAYQQEGGAKRNIPCSYILHPDGSVGFRLASYDPTQPLVIDPIVDFMTYLGGDMQDHILAVGADSNGNVVVAGATSSSNFPGIQQTANSTAMFVSKLNSAGTAILFTTVLHTRTGAVSDSVVGSLAVDEENNIFLTGVNSGPGFPISANAWQKTGFNYVMKLSPTGAVLYSTYLGQAGGTPLAIRVRGGNAYVAGNLTGPDFLGTTGAYRRSSAGATDIFVTGVNADGSALLFATAYGGSADETFLDMALEADGNIVFAGTSRSADLPATVTTTPAPAGAQSSGFLARINSNGSTLLYSRWLGSASIAGIAPLPSGDVVLGGYNTLPTDMVDGAPKYSLAPANGSSAGWITKLTVNNGTLWSVELGRAGMGLRADAEGNLYFLNAPTVISGGAFTYSSSGTYGIQKVSADGSRLLYATTVPDAFSFSNSTYLTPTALRMFVDASGIVWIGGFSGATWAPTPGVVQAARDPAAAGSQFSPRNNDDGIVARFDLRNFSQSSFFVSSTNAPELKWRMGEVLPQPLVVPVQLTGPPLTLQATAPEGLNAVIRDTPSGLAITIDPSRTVVGSSRPVVTVRAPSIPNSELGIAVPLTIRPAVGFDVSQTDVEVGRRIGQDQTAVNVPVTTNFGNEYFEIQTESSDRTWLFPYYDTYGKQISISLGAMPVGTYQATITAKLKGEMVDSVPTRTIRVRYIVEAASVLKVSTASLQLHVVRNQTAPVVKVQVTSTPSGAGFTMIPGGFPWFQVTRTASTTPAEIQITADSSQPAPGIYNYAVFLYGEDGNRITINVQVDVSSGAPIDLSANKLEYYFDRGFCCGQLPELQITSPTPQPVQWSIDQPWTSLGSGTSSGTTPVRIVLGFDTSLTEGVRTATLTIRSGTSVFPIPVTYTLYDAVTLVYPATPLSFRYQIGGLPPPAQTFEVKTAQLRQGHFNAYAMPADGRQAKFTSVSPGMTFTPVTMSISVDPTGLMPGTYRDEVVIQGDSSFLTGPTPRIPVTLEVLPDPNGGTAGPQLISSVTNGASYLAGTVSPGEIAVLFGTAMAADPLTVAQPDSTGKFGTALAGTRIFFDDIAAPIVYTSAKQIAVVAPFALLGKTQTRISVEKNGQRSAPFTMNVAKSNPGLFTANSAGSGGIAAYNIPPSGPATLHSASNPIDKGGVLTLFGSGFGSMTPAVPDGAAVNVPLPHLQEDVRVLVGGREAEVLYSGPAPTYIAGLMQLNIRVPATAGSGVQSLIVLVGDAVSQPGVTVYVK